MIKKASLFLLSFGVLLLICEVVFRVAGYDFSGEVETWHRMPPFYRQPTVPTGDVFFRRPGPETWSGPVISTYLDLLGVDPEPASLVQRPEVEARFFFSSL